MSNIEEFRQIADYPDYLVSSKGRVYSSKTDKFLEPEVTRKGYLRVALSDNGDAHKKLVHVLVAEAFLYKYAPNLQVNHISEDKADNSVDNLEYVTQSENQRHNNLNVRLGEARTGKYRKRTFGGVSKAEDPKAYNKALNARPMINKITGEIAPYNAVKKRAWRGQTNKSDWDYV